MAIVVELLSRDDKVINHFFVDKPSVSIGRAYDNDVRLEDPYVSPYHVSFEDSEESIKLSDKESLNGVKVNKTAVIESQVSPSDIITIGRSRLRVFHHHNSVAPTIQLSQLEEDIEWMSSRKVCAALLAVFCVLAGTQYFVNSIVDVKTFVLIKVVLTLVGAACIWPFSFALLSKLAKKDSRIISQFSLIWMFLIGLELTDYVFIWAEFNFNPSLVLNILSLLTKGILFFLLFWFSLFVAFHQPARVRNRIALLGLFLVSIPTLSPYFIGQDQFRASPAYSIVILPPMFNLVSPTDTNDFIQDSSDIYESLALEKAEER